MKAEITTDYKGLDIVVDSADPEFSRLSIQDLKKCENAIVEKSEYGWTAIIDDFLYQVTKGKDSHYGHVLYADLIN